MSIKSLARYKLLSYILFGLGVITLTVGIVLSLQRGVVASVKAPLAQAAASPPSTAHPSTDDINGYQVAADLPRYINIPKLNIKARVLSLGVTKENAIATPGNVFDVGWYSGSSKPGLPGAMVVDGHVSSISTHGIFYSLGKLKTNDIITIERGDGHVFTYSVASTQTYPYNSVDMTKVLKPVDPNLPGLNLITCTGQVIKGTNEFDKRIVVFAKQV